MPNSLNLPIVDPLDVSVNTGSDLVNTPPQKEQALSSADTRNKIIERKVYIKTVKEIAEHDYPQASKTWAALEAAGIEPGDLVANALEQGHGYQSSTIVINGPFIEKDVDSLLGESLSEGERLVSYKYIDDKKLLGSQDQQGGNGMEIVMQSREITIAEEDNRPRAVKLIAILRKKLPNLLK